MERSPFGATYRGRGRVPLPVLSMIAVLPALAVSAVVMLRAPDAPPPAAPAAGPAAARPATQQAAETPPGATAMAAATATGTAATADPSATVAPRPASLGVQPPEITAASAVVVDEASLAVLYNKAAFQRRPPASLTKIATAIVAIERGRLDDLVTSEVHHWDVYDSTSMGLEPGDVFSLRELLYGMMLVSGNDAAAMIARHIAGEEAAFVAEMNALVQRLGLTDTHFTNAAGWHEDAHYSSAWDIAMLSRYLMRFPDLRQIVGTETHTAAGTRDGKRIEFDLYNHNPLLNYTPGVDGVKTGFIEQAGRTYSVSVSRGGHRIYVVLMDTVLRAQDSQDLIEWAFANHVWTDGSSRAR